MSDRNWRLPKKYYIGKSRKTKYKSGHQSKDELKSALKDEDKLKKKKKRLSLDWFFRPQGD
jgi:hypothetical protein